MAKNELSDFTKKAIEMAREERFQDGRWRYEDEDIDDRPSHSGERTVSIELTVPEACFIIELIELKINAHKSYADQAIKKGYGTVVSYNKRDQHLKRADDLKVLIQKLSENLV